MCFSISFFIDFWKVLELFWEVLGAPGRVREGGKRIPKASLKKNSILGRFGKDFGRVLGGFWEGLGATWALLGRAWGVSWVSWTSLRRF